MEQQTSPNGSGGSNGSTPVAEQAAAVAETAQEQALEVAETTKTEAAAVVGEAKEQARSVAETTKEEGAAVVADTKERALAVASTTKSEAVVVVEEAKSQALDLVAEARAQVRNQAEVQAGRIAGVLGDFARQLTAMADAGQAQGEDGSLIELTRQAADRTSRWAERIEDGGADELADDVKRLARERPGLFLLGVAGAGFAAGRLAKGVDRGGVTRAARAGASANGSGTAVVVQARNGSGAGSARPRAAGRGS